MVEAFPLNWPDGFNRHTGAKLDSKFASTLAQARDGVNIEIERMRGSQVVISTNIPTKANGDLYASGRPVDGDHGVAVYFYWKGEQRVLACDQYRTVRENLRAIEKSIEAMRGLERWGCSDILNRTFSGFKALPQNAGASNGSWWQILGVEQSSPMEYITAAYKQKVQIYHPDKPTGNRSMFDLVQTAYEEAKKARG